MGLICTFLAVVCHGQHGGSMGKEKDGLQLIALAARYDFA